MKREITRKEKVEDKAYRVADYGGYHGFYADGMQEYEIQANLKQRGYSSYYSETDDFRKTASSVDELFKIHDVVAMDGVREEFLVIWLFSGLCLLSRYSQALRRVLSFFPKM